VFGWVCRRTWSTGVGWRPIFGTKQLGPMGHQVPFWKRLRHDPVQLYLTIWRRSLFDPISWRALTVYDVAVSLEYLKDRRRPGLKQSAAGHGVKTSVDFEICTEAFARSLRRSRSAVCPLELDRFVAEKEQAINRGVFWADKRIEIFVEFRGTRSALPPMHGMHSRWSNEPGLHKASCACCRPAAACIQGSHDGIDRPAVRGSRCRSDAVHTT